MHARPLASAEQCGVAFTAFQLGARFAQLHFSFEPLDLEADAPLYHLGLPGEYLLLEPYFQARLAQRSSYAHGVRTFDCE